MRIGEVCLLTSNVIRLANFYKLLFGIDNESNDDTHQFIISEETTLTVYNDGVERKSNPHNIALHLPLMMLMRNMQDWLNLE